MKYIELVDLYEAIGATTKRFESAIENGYEGLILKSSASGYQAGAQLKKINQT